MFKNYFLTNDRPFDHQFRLGTLVYE